MSIGVYKITNIINNKFYIGSSKNIEKRLKNHFNNLKNNTHCNKHLQNAYNKYGKDAFISEILEITSEYDLRSREDYYIKKTKCYDGNIGYNIAKGAIGGGSDYFTEETLQKLRKPKSELAIKHLKEAFAKNGSHKGVKNSNYGKHWSKEWKQQQSIRLKNNEGVKNSPRFKNKKHTEESKFKTRQSLRLNNVKKLNLPFNPVKTLSFIFATNNKSMRLKDTSILVRNKVEKFFNDCLMFNKRGVFIIPFEDTTTESHLYMLNEQTFLEMKEALEKVKQMEKHL